MELFHRVEDAVAVTRCKGVYKQVDVYRRGVLLYVRHGGGYVRMRGAGRTSVPDLFVDAFEVPRHMRADENPAAGEVVLVFDA